MFNTDELNFKNLEGIFISVEGNEYSGKSTLVRNAKEQLSFKNIETFITKEPGATERGSILREWVTNPTGAFAENHHLRAMGFAMDRAIHVHEFIYPHLKEGNLVISDRYIDSSYVLQGILQGRTIKEINFFNEKANNISNIRNIYPYKTIFINTNEDTAIKRSKKRIESNLMDTEFMKKFQEIKNAYLYLAELFPDRFIIIDGNAEQEVVQGIFNQTIIDIVQSKN